MVFDEVDAAPAVPWPVAGGSCAAWALGASPRRDSPSHRSPARVISICVAKLTDGRSTHHVTALTADARIEEIARMLGGLEITARARSHAVEMLSARQQRANANPATTAAPARHAS
jgi:hypothetical protein